MTMEEAIQELKNLSLLEYDYAHELYALAMKIESECYLTNNPDCQKAAIKAHVTETVNRMTMKFSELQESEDAIFDALRG